MSELYDKKTRVLKPKFYESKKVRKILQRRHKRGYGLIEDDNFYRTYDADGDLEHEWKVPYGVRYALKKPLNHSQLVHKYPWYVTWVSKKSGKRLKKYFMSIPQAIHFIATRTQYADKNSAIVCRIGLDIPPKLRGKLPSPWRWCPRCMAPRRLKAVAPQEEFYALVKTWNEEKQRYEWPERRLRVLKCKVCGCTNRDGRFRRNNQPWEVRKFKRGVYRAKRKGRGMTAKRQRR